MKQNLSFPILTGLFIGTSYIPFPPWAMLFGIAPVVVGLVRLFEATDFATTSRRRFILQSFFLGWLSQFILNAIGFHWIATTAIEFGHFPKWAGILTLIGFCAIAHLYYAFAGAVAAGFAHSVYKRFGSRVSGPLFVGVYFSSFAVIEFLWPSIFPWHLGYPWLWAGLPGAQFADVIGFEGLNLVCLFTNGLFAVGWLRWNSAAPSLVTRLKPALPWMASGIAVFIAVNVAGIGREKPWQTTNSTLKLIIAQGNIGNYEKLIVEKQKEFSVPIIETYMKLTTKGFVEHPEATFALWPETAFPDFLDQVFSNEKNWKTIRTFTQSRQKMVLTGAYSYEPDIKTTYNGFFAMDSFGNLVGKPYRKSILIPFGERFPFSDIIPYMKWLFPGLGSFGSGPGPSVMELGYFRLGPQICLESLYPKFSASMALQGAEVFSNVTNDSWFGKTFEPYQHMTMTLARAVENRRPLLRATNTGITTVMLADGRQLAQSPIAEEWYGYYEVPFIRGAPVALYSRIAGYSVWLGLAVCLAFAGVTLRRALRK